MRKLKVANMRLEGGFCFDFYFFADRMTTRVRPLKTWRLIMKEFTETIRDMLEKADSLWLYNGEPDREKPHTLLASGRHSNGYANVGDFLKNHPAERVMLAGLLLFTLRQ